MDILKKEICFLSKEKLFTQNKGKNYTKEIILSPYYYWYFERKLPVSNLKRAKAIAIQMLETSLPSDRNFEYVLFQKEKNIFEVFVLDLERVITKLNQLGIEKKSVSSFGFANKEFEPSKIELDNSCLYITEDEACEVGSEQNINNDLFFTNIHKALEAKEKLKFRYSFGKGDILEDIINSLDKNFLAIAAIFIFVFAAFFIQSLGLIKIEKNYNTKKETLLAKQSYATHAIQLKYVMNEMLDLDVKQKKFILGLKDLTSIQSNNNTYLDFIRYDNGEWNIKVVSNDKNQAAKLVETKRFKFLRQDGKAFIFERIR